MKKTFQWGDGFIPLFPHDYVIHQHHGIGQFEGLETVTVHNHTYECCRLLYENQDKLFLPVAHIHLLSRYASSHAQVPLDTLGGQAWKKRKAQVQKRLHMMMAQLMDIALKRSQQEGWICSPHPDRYHSFCQAFPYTLTQDQEKSTQEVMHDLTSGVPMDRVICGDVGFGKTEVAMRAAFAVVDQGLQVIVLCPTTLLCRQHTSSFRERFAHTNIRIDSLSRLNSEASKKATLASWEQKKTHILITTHAVFHRRWNAENLGMVILDEEQHFGVKQKEKLKTFQVRTHLLTLSATPIPRTLHMALSGVRSYSVITTPPKQRVGVNIHVIPWKVSRVLKALDAEKSRGGQSFLVVPHIADLEDLAALIQEHRPDWHYACLHGQMSPETLDQNMISFSDQQLDVLISTAIIESGLDLPHANTIIIHKADHFGLANLYQLKGRVGRGNVMGQAYLTYHEHDQCTDQAKKRLEVMSQLNPLGGNITLSYHDMDIRGVGNVLGAEQSGHIRDIGIELYQKILLQRQKGQEADILPDWTPTLNLGLSAYIPSSWIADPEERLQAYRFISQKVWNHEEHVIQPKLQSTFGVLPQNVDHFIRLTVLQRHCVMLNIEQVDTGPRGVVLTFHKGTPPSPEKIVPWITQHPKLLTLKPEGQLICHASWTSDEKRLKNIENIINALRKAIEHS